MPGTIEQTKEAILKHGGKVSKHQIARELKISLDHAGFICGELKRKGESEECRYAFNIHTKDKLLDRSVNLKKFAN